MNKTKQSFSTNKQPLNELNDTPNLGETSSKLVVPAGTVAECTNEYCYLEHPHPSPAPQRDSWEDRFEIEIELLDNEDEDQWLERLKAFIKQEIAGAVAEAKAKSIITIIGLYYGVIKDLYGEEIATLIQNRVNAVAESHLSPQEDNATTEGDKK